MYGFRTLAQRLETLFGDERAWPASRRWPIKIAKCAYLFTRKARSDHALERAASLAFATTISIVPLLVILFLLFHNLFDFDEKIAEIRSYLIQLVGPESRADVTAMLAEFEDGLRAPLTNSAAVTPVALLGLMISAMSLYRTAERNFSAVWNVELKRSFLQRLANFWLILTAIPFILGMSFLPDLSETEVARPDFVVGIIQQFVFPVSISFFGFFVLFAYLPSARVRFDSTALGALLSACVWVVGTQAFVYYVRNWGQQTVYGALGVLPVFLVWVFYSWLVAISGCEIAYCLQNFRMLENEIRYHLDGETLPSSVLAVLIMEQVYERFSTSGAEPLERQHIADGFALPISECDRMIETLREAGLIVTDSDGAIAPRRSADLVTLADVVAVFPGGNGFDIPDGFLSLERSRIRELIDGLGRSVTAELRQHSFAG